MKKQDWKEWAEGETEEVEVFHAGYGWVSSEEHCRLVEAEQAAAKTRKEQ